MSNYLSKTTVIFLFSGLFSCCCFGQLSSFTPTYEVVADSTSGGTTLNLSITFDDISDLGGVQISAYDAATGQFIKEYQATRSELIASGYLTSEHLYFQLLKINDGQQYRVQMNAYNLDGAYIELEELTTTL